MRRVFRWFVFLGLVSPFFNLAHSAANDPAARIARILRHTPLIDGHNDLPWEIRERFKGELSKINLSSDTSLIPAPAGSISLMTDIPRLHRGQVGAQFWSVWVPVQMQGAAAVQATLEQIDIVRRMNAQYHNDLEMAYTADDIRRIHRAGRIGSLIGIEGGHQINNSLASLRQMYELGVRYMTLTHVVNTDWADSATDAPKHRGLTRFGREVVREMNRLGMLVDLSHVSPETMRAALETSEAPVMFSHSSARALVDHPRNVPDDILRLVALNGGIVMVNFFPFYVSSACNQWASDYGAEEARYNNPPFRGLYVGQPERAKLALDAWATAHPRPRATLAQVADHIEHVKQIAGIEHVGIGSDFDGMPEAPQGLSGVDRYPALLTELMRRGWTDDEIAKLAGENLLRVLAAADKVGVGLRAARAPSTALIAELDAKTN